MAEEKEKNVKNDIGLLFKSDTPKILLDTNVIFAYINPKNQFHLEAKSAVDALNIKGYYFLFPHIILGEFLNHRSLIGGKPSVRTAITKISNFQRSLTNKLMGGRAIDTKQILKSYLRHYRHADLTKNGLSDFLILTEVEDINNIRLLTCDKKFYICGKKIFKKNIYYLPSRSKGVKSDFARLMLEIQKDFS